MDMLAAGVQEWPSAAPALPTGQHAAVVIMQMLADRARGAGSDHLAGCVMPDDLDRLLAVKSKLKGVIQRTHHIDVRGQWRMIGNVERRPVRNSIAAGRFPPSPQPFGQAALKVRALNGRRIDDLFDNSKAARSKAARSKAARSKASRLEFVWVG
jgi:hypothetical protein